MQAIEGRSRSGAREGVGRITLTDLPSMRAEHDASSRREMKEWALARGKV